MNTTHIPLPAAPPPRASRVGGPSVRGSSSVLLEPKELRQRALSFGCHGKQTGELMSERQVRLVEREPRRLESTRPVVPFTACVTLGESSPLSRRSLLTRRVW